MALVSLSSVAAFFLRRRGDDGKRSENACDLRRVANFLFDKEPGHASAMVHASMRGKTYPVQVSFSDSLWARIRQSRTKCLSKRETKVRTRKLKFSNFYF